MLFKNVSNRMMQSEAQWGSYYANAHPHMNNRSTNRVEGTHAAMKQSIGTSKGKMGPVTDKIDHWYKTRVRSNINATLNRFS